MTLSGHENSDLENLPPSCKLVLKVFEYESEDLPGCDGPALTRQRLLEETELSPSTLDDALRTLENRQAIHISSDARRADRVVAELRQSQQS